VRAIDEWYEASDTVEMTAQIIVDEATGYHPKHFKWAPYLDANTYTQKIQNAKVVVSHAGMGSIISAMTYQKPIILLPRKAELGEHRNDHQLATAHRFRSRPGIFVADEAEDIPGLLDQLLNDEDAKLDRIPDFADESLLAAIRDVIQS